MEKQKTYLIYDLGCSAAIIAAGYELMNLDRTNPSRVGFIFENSEPLQSDVNAYWANRLSVDARTLNENSKMLKTRIYSEK